MVQKNKWEDEEEASRAASYANASLQRVKIPRWQHRQERKDAVSGPKKKKGNIKQTTAWARQEHEQEKKSSSVTATCVSKRQCCLGSEEPIDPSHAWQNDVKASVDNTWQISPFRHLLLVGSVVLDGTNGYHEHSSKHNPEISSKFSTKTVRKGGC